jgi:hypothetical protein
MVVDYGIIIGMYKQIDSDSKVNQAQKHSFQEHLKYAAEIVKNWPEWKQKLLGNYKHLNR